MKIALFHNLPSGGGKRALHEFTRLLKQRGHTLVLYNLSLTDEEFLPLTPYVDRVITSSIRRFHLLQTRLLPFVIQYINFPRRIAYLYTLKALQEKIAREIDRQNYDLVFVHHCKIIQSPYVLRYLKTPSVYYCQEPPRRMYEPEIRHKHLPTTKQRIQAVWYAPANTLLRQKIKRDDSLNARSATLLLVNSYFSGESIYRVYGVNARVNYLGVNLDTFHFRHSSEKQHCVIAVGRTYPEKGHEFIIRSLSHLPTSLRPKLIIVADMRDPVEEHYLAEVAANGSVEFTIFHDISDQELVQWYQRAKVCVYAPIMEPFGFVPLEAMACGLPVVAVKEGGVRETVRDGETGFLAQRDPEEFAEKVRVLLENPDLRKRFSEQARRYVETSWTWEQSVEELLKNFARVQ